MKKIIILSAITALTLSADPLATYIGAKAKSMGGAFTAVANNNSAIYFNPAGLTNFDGLKNIMLTLEVGAGAQFDQSATTLEDMHSSTGSFFFGISSIGKDGGIGFAMYSLYDLNLRDGAGNYFIEEVNVMSLSGSYCLIDKLYPYGGKLAIGLTGANASSSSSETDTNTLDVSGYFYAVGLKYRVLNHRAFKIDIGVNYRSSATLESDTEYTSKKFVAVGVPQELAYGIAASYGTEIGLFTLAGDYKDTAYDDATKESDFTLRIPDITTVNLGLEFATSLFQLRAGTYKSSYADNTVDGEITGMTAGVGVIIGGSLSLEGAYDNRTYSYNNLPEETSTAYYTVSVNMAF